MRGQAYVEIVEQPASNAFRFRYESERRTHGSIPGVNSTPEKKTFPTIRVVGPYKHGRVVVSCVTLDDKRAHPNRLVSKEACIYHGVYITSLELRSNLVEFRNLGIQCVKRKEIKRSLQERRHIGVDPFGQGFDDTAITADDLNAVRLCFQVYLRPPGYPPGEGEIQLKPVVSNPIYARGSLLDLAITQLSSFIASAAGGTTLILFCQKVFKDDVKVRFFEERNGRVTWERFGKFESKDIYEQSAIVLTTPAYHKSDVDHPIDISVQLIRPSTNDCGKPVCMQLVSPSAMCKNEAEADVEMSLKRKRKNFNNIHLLENANRAPCGCILAPIINPDCPIHNPQARNLNPALNFIRNRAGYDSPYNTLQSRPKYFYYNENISSEGLMSLAKKAKYSVPLAPPLDPVQPPASNPPLEVPQLSPEPFSPPPCKYQSTPPPIAASNPPLQVPQLSPEPFSRPPCEYQSRPPPNAASYQQSPSPHRSQCMFQSSYPRNDSPIVPDGAAMPFDNQTDWQVQTEPTLQPILVKLSEEQAQSSNYDVPKRPEAHLIQDYSISQIDMNENLLDFDVANGVNDLSDSLSDGIRINEEELEDFYTYETKDDNGISMGGLGVYEENEYAVQGILNAAQNQQSYMDNPWTWDA